MTTSPYHKQVKLENWVDCSLYLSPLIHNMLSSNEGTVCEPSSCPDLGDQVRLGPELTP